MSVTIIREDNFVSIDGVGFTVDCSSLPINVNAIQWGGDHGEIEYVVTRCDHCGARTKKGNEWITDIKPYAHLIAAWREADEAARAQASEREAHEKARQQVLDAAVQKRLAEKQAARGQADAARGQADAAGPES